MARRLQNRSIYHLHERRSRRRLISGFPLALFICAAVGFIVIYSGLAPAIWQQVLHSVAPTEADRVGVNVTARAFATCSGRGMSTCVIDGDTIRLNGTSIRIADIDTPEVYSPQCPEELALGNQATRRMVQLLNGSSFELVGYDSRDEDVYGRKLRVLMRDGQSLGQVLVAEGLARSWDGARHPWC